MKPHGCLPLLIGLTKGHPQVDSPGPDVRDFSEIVLLHLDHQGNSFVLVRFWLSGLDASCPWF